MVTAYGVTAAEVATVAAGYDDGTFRPSLEITRDQFSKMVVDGFGLAKLSPVTPSFNDVPATHFFYQWIEGAAGAGIVTGYPNGDFGPAQKIERQQANTILGRYLSGKEIAATGGVLGDLGRYPTLAAWYAAEGAGILAPFADASQLALVHAPFTAYLIYHEVVWGSSSGVNIYLRPAAYLSRAQAAALILRVKGVAFESVPKDLTVTATGVNKAYDGTTTATVTLASADIVSGDTVVLSYTAANFATPNVGTGKTVNVSGISISGAQAGNYNLLNTTAVTTANITPKDLTVTGAVANNKTYDGTTTATVNFAGATLVGVAGGDTVTLNTSGYTANFTTAGVGTNKPVTVTGVTLTAPRPATTR